MNIEEKLRGALDAPAPPPTTTLDHVLKRGRRRVFAQRAGAMLGVVVAVAGIGIGATTLNHAAPDRMPADQPNEAPATVEHAVGWPRVSTPPQVPHGTWTPTVSAPAGWPTPTLPLCDTKAPSIARPVELGGELPSQEFVSTWLDQARKLLPGSTLGDAKVEPSQTQYRFDVSDSRGTGSIRIFAARFVGTPLANADDTLWEAGDCEPARRLLHPNGSVAQLHSVRPYGPYQTLTQTLDVFRKDGLLVQLEMHNFGSPSYNVSDPGNLTNVQRAGRPTLPLSDEQFEKLGLALAEAG